MPEQVTHLLDDLPHDLWAGRILQHVGASELIRLQRVCHTLHVLTSHACRACFQPVIQAERERRASMRQSDRDRRRRDSRYSRHPAIVKAALDCNVEAVVAALESGAAVDECAKWVETQEKFGGYEKSWTWSMDTALSIACSQGHLPMIELLLAHGANLKHSVCNTEDEHYTPAEIARQHGHITCADYMDRVIDMREAPHRAAHRQHVREKSIRLRREARRLRAAGPPYPASAEGVSAQIFACAARDFLNGLGYERYLSQFSDRHASGEEVDRAESAAFAVLALEVLRTQSQLTPCCYWYYRHGDYMEMIEHLRAMPDVAGALETAREFEEHADAEEERWRLADEQAARQHREQVELQRQEQERQRALERARCQRSRPGTWWMTQCTNNRCYDYDSCTYGHADHDLPPRCRWGTGCRNGESCWYNHLGDRRLSDMPCTGLGAAQGIAAPHSAMAAPHSAMAAPHSAMAAPHSVCEYPASVMAPSIAQSIAGAVDRAFGKIERKRARKEVELAETFKRRREEREAARAELEPVGPCAICEESVYEDCYGEVEWSCANLCGVIQCYDCSEKGLGICYRCDGNLGGFCLDCCTCGHVDERASDDEREARRQAFALGYPDDDPDFYSYNQFYPGPY